MSRNCFLLTLNSRFEVCTSANNLSTCFKAFARLLTINLTLWLVKVENSEIKKYNIEKNIILLEYTNPKKFKDNFNFFKQVVTGPKRFIMNFVLIPLGWNMVPLGFKPYFINIIAQTYQLSYIMNVIYDFCYSAIVITRFGYSWLSFAVKKDFSIFQLEIFRELCGLLY